jgi:hypothetical protein
MPPQMPPPQVPVPPPISVQPSDLQLRRRRRKRRRCGRCLCQNRHITLGPGSASGRRRRHGRASAALRRSCSNRVVLAASASYPHAALAGSGAASDNLYVLLVHGLPRVANRRCCSVQHSDPELGTTVDFLGRRRRCRSRQWGPLQHSDGRYRQRPGACRARRRPWHALGARARAASGKSRGAAVLQGMGLSALASGRSTGNGVTPWPPFPPPESDLRTRRRSQAITLHSRARQILRIGRSQPRHGYTSNVGRACESP